MESETMTTTMIQGKEYPVGLRDKKNWEKHTTPDQRNNPNFKTSFGDGLKEKYDTIPERPEGDNYRDKVRRLALAKRIEVETEFLDKYKDNIDEKSMKKYRADIDKLREDLDNVGKTELDKKLPNIPMGKNTHKTNVEGFVYGKTKINIQKGVLDGDDSIQMLRQRLETVWNALPDSDRDIIKTFNVKKSLKRKRGGTTRNGSWNPNTKSLNMNLKNGGVEKTFFHELGHAKWYDMKDKKPEAVKKFIETFKTIGTSPTEYSESYRRHAVKTERYYMDKQRRIERHRSLTPEEREIIRISNERAKDLYENESHAELNAYVMGFLPNNKITADEASMNKLLDAYKEMWDL